MGIPEVGFGESECGEGGFGRRSGFRGRVGRTAEVAGIPVQKLVVVVVGTPTDMLAFVPGTLTDTLAAARTGDTLVAAAHTARDPSLLQHPHQHRPRPAPGTPSPPYPKVHHPYPRHP